MSDHDALLRAICEFPDDDTPRLIFADYLEENRQPERAAFIRAQIELAHTPEWEPFAVLCRHRKPDWSVGGAFRDTLPPIDGWHATWPGAPFRRGFGWALGVASLVGWEDFAPRLFASAPVGELTLPTATLDDWRRFAAGDWVRHLRRVNLTTSPVEPVRVLSNTPAAAGITDLKLGRASSPAIPEVVEDLFRTPLGRQLRGLTLHAGRTALEHLMDAIAGSGATLDRLSFSNMGMTGELTRRLCQWPGAAGLKALEFRDEPLGSGLEILATHLHASDLHTLTLSTVGVQPKGLEALGAADSFAGVRRLDLSRNPLRPRATRVLAAGPALAGLRSLNLSRCVIGDKGVRHLASARFWPNLVELDLRENPISAAGARHLMNVPVPPDLTALLLDARGLDGDARSKLRQHFGDRVVLSQM